MKRVVPTAVAIIVGLLTLAGYFVPALGFHQVLTRWAATLAAVALLLGLLNLLGVHFRRIANQERNWPYSIVLIFSAVVVIVMAVVENRGPGGAAVSWIFHAVLQPLEAAAASLLLFFLVAAAFRAMRQRPSWSTFLFVGSMLLVLLGAVPFAGQAGQVFGQVRSWLVNVFATAGARGLLLGVALGTLATGIRVLIGIDRPHSEREL